MRFWSNLLSSKYLHTSSIDQYIGFVGLLIVTLFELEKDVEADEVGLLLIKDEFEAETKEL